MEPDELRGAPTAWQSRIGWALIFVGAAVLLYSRWRPIRLGRTGRGWFELVIGLAALVHTRDDIRQGVTSMRWAKFARADDPSSYWVAIATGFIVGLALVAFSVQDLLGL